MTTVERTLKTNLLVGNDNLTAAIGKIKAAGKKLDGMIQVAGLSILNHIQLHGDITQFEALWAAMPQGARKNALAEWAFKFGKISANTDANTKSEKPFLFDREKKTDLFSAEDQPWFMFKPEKPVDQEFDFAKLMGMLMAKAEKAEAQGLPITGAESLKAVRAAMAAVSTAPATAVEA
jgi:hypothetical protein